MTDKNAPTSFSSILRREDGQLTIFLAIGLTIFMTMMAFIINVGLFVKAKINLQNATDAAAWSGAAVQARQLSQIAYLNYEMRNVYKEWMFKYYILGNLGNTLRIANTSKSGDFRLAPAGNLNVGTNFDKYNIPSICVHAGTGSNDVCLSSFIPGLPRFETVDLPNITDESQRFIDAISSKKADDCAYRSSINFITAMQWTYGTRDVPISSDLPALATGRIGAWPAAFLLGVRVRTLEAMVNRPPESRPLCFGGANCNPVDSINTSHTANERPIKAFYALARNYSGGEYKQNGGGMDESLSTLRLEELSPQPTQAGEASLSGMLIPASQPPEWNPNPLTKYYLDLQAIPINYAIFYTSMSARTEDLTIDGTTLPSDASCTTVKTAIPVPAYLLGFQKNPKLLTYYAVRSSVKFTGLFFPTSWLDTSGAEGGGGVTISAVSAAKPFGGRIGPRLFNVDDTLVRPREPSHSPKSAPLISGLRYTGPTSGPGVLQPGTPIPNGANFWVSDVTSIVGGVPGSGGANPKYVIPNMLYSFSDPSSANTEVAAHMATGGPAFTSVEAYNSFEAVKREVIGLYNEKQFDSLFENLSEVDSGSGVFDSDDLTTAVTKVRQPTYYDTLNYLIPSIKDIPSFNIKANKNGTADLIANDQYQNDMILYGPLVDNSGAGNSLYRNSENLQELVVSYIDKNRESINTFLSGLENVARAIKSSGSGTLYDKAAAIIYPIGTSTDNNAAFELEMGQSTVCGGNGTVSVAARFSSFLRSLEGPCPAAGSLAMNIRTLIENMINGNSINGLYHSDIWWRGEFSRLGKNSEDEGIVATMSAYRPGLANGASSDGYINNPLNSAPPYPNMRNYYSTKFIQFDLVSPTPTRGEILPLGIHERYSSPNDQGMLQDVADLLTGGISNKLQEDIAVRW